MESKILNRIITRSQVIEDSDNKPAGKDGSKRLADPLPDLGSKKRILGDITNQVKQANVKSNAVLKRTTKHGSHCNENSLPDSNLSKDSSSNKLKNKSESASEDTFYVTALEQCESESGSESKDGSSDIADTSVEETLPDGVEDYDKWARHDPYNESRYAADIFKYYREREKKFTVTKYLQKQSEITKGMRAILVDWMVEVQESFELNHETLYLAVKLVDRYLMSHFVPKALLQLLGATTLFVAAKFDERQPPLVDDFLYICDDTYTRAQLLSTEIRILQTIDFDLGIPLSYRFLRRYARCSKMSMEMLTLARYILEASLMDYELIEVPDSKIAAAALLLALKMKKQTWNATHQYYSGYKESELQDIMIQLNKNISSPPSRHLQTIHLKYSHKIFFEVSKIPALQLKKAVQS